MHLEFDFDPLDSSTINDLSRWSLLPLIVYGLENDINTVEISKIIKEIIKSQDNKAEVIFDDLSNKKNSGFEEDDKIYKAIASSFSNFKSIYESIRSTLKSSYTETFGAGENLITKNRSFSSQDKEKISLTLAAISIGYCSLFSEKEDFWLYFNKNQKDLYVKIIGEAPSEIESFIKDSFFSPEKISFLSKSRRNISSNTSMVSEELIFLFGFINVEKVFPKTQVDLPLMKDSEIQSYRISGKMKYYSDFITGIPDCEVITVDGYTGYRDYPCNRVQIRPRDLEIDQLIYDGPYSTGNIDIVDGGLRLLDDLHQSNFPKNRKVDGEMAIPVNGDTSRRFLSYGTGWGIEPTRPVDESYPHQWNLALNMPGDIKQISEGIEGLKNFPLTGLGTGERFKSGHFHFLGSYDFTNRTKNGVPLYDKYSHYSGFQPLMFGLNTQDKEKIFSGLKINLYDKKRNKEQILAYCLSDATDILVPPEAYIIATPSGETESKEVSDNNRDACSAPLLNIKCDRPSYAPPSVSHFDFPMMGINLNFSAKSFNKKPSAKFNFINIWYQEPSNISKGGYFCNASDFSFTGFDLTGDFFNLSSGSIKFDNEISNTDNISVKNAFGAGDEDSFLLQKALGFANYNTVIYKDIKTGEHYGVQYKYIEPENPSTITIFKDNVRVIVNEKELHNSKIIAACSGIGAIEKSEWQPAMIMPMDGNVPYSLFKYATGVKNEDGSVSGLSIKSVFGPTTLEELSASTLSMPYETIPSGTKAEDVIYTFPNPLNPGRYYSGLFASEKQVFIYPNASGIYEYSNKHFPNESGIYEYSKNKHFPIKIKLNLKIEEKFSKAHDGSLHRLNASLEPNETIENAPLKTDGIWVDENYCMFANVLTYNPISKRNTNAICYNIKPNPEFKIIKDRNSYDYYDGILDGELVGPSVASYQFYDVQRQIVETRYLPNIPFTTGEIKSSTQEELILSYNLPSKSLSDFQQVPEHSARSFSNTGSKMTVIYHGPYGDFVSYTGLTEQINIDVHTSCDPLFRTNLDINKNISGDSWNGIILKSGTVHYSWNGYPYRDQNDDRFLIEATDNSGSLKLFLRRLTIFPTFPMNEGDFSYGQENLNLTDSSLSSQLEKENLTKFGAFSLSTKSVLKALESAISFKEEKPSFTKNLGKNIVRKGKLFWIPRELLNSGFADYEISQKEYEKISKIFGEEFGKGPFYSGISDGSNSYAYENKLYYINFKESSRIDITIDSPNIEYQSFPLADELFDFHTTGKANFSGILAYNSQEESCIITHGVRVKLENNPDDVYLSMGHKFDHCSPVMADYLKITGDRLFPTRKRTRVNKIISGDQSKNVYAKVGIADYNNFFHMNMMNENTAFSQDRSSVGSLAQDRFLYPNATMISSSSEDYKEEYEDGTFLENKKIDKIYKVSNSLEFYQSYFTDPYINTGSFIKHLKTGAEINANKESKRCLAAINSSISDLKFSENAFVSFIPDRVDSETGILVDEMKIPEKPAEKGEKIISPEDAEEWMLG